MNSTSSAKSTLKKSNTQQENHIKALISPDKELKSHLSHEIINEALLTEKTPTNNKTQTTKKKELFSKTKTPMPTSSTTTTTASKEPNFEF